MYANDKYASIDLHDAFSGLDQESINRGLKGVYAEMTKHQPKCKDDVDVTQAPDYDEDYDAAETQFQGPMDEALYNLEAQVSSAEENIKSLVQALEPYLPRSWLEDKEAQQGDCEISPFNQHGSELSSTVHSINRQLNNLHYLNKRIQVITESIVR